MNPMLVMLHHRRRDRAMGVITPILCVVLAMLLPSLTPAVVRGEGPGTPIINGPPPGWELVKINDDPEQDRHVAMNSRNQIVFSKRHIPNPNGTMEEIYLYDNGRLCRLTFDEALDESPDINDDGVIVWQRLQPWGESQIVRWENGVLEPISDPNMGSGLGSIGDSGLIMWSGTLPSGAVELFEWRDGVITQVTSNGLTNRCITINANDDFSWVRYNFNAQPSWRSTIMASIEGEILELTDGTTQAQGCGMNDAGIVGWNDVWGVQLWFKGEITVIDPTPDGQGPVLNNPGRAVYANWLDTYWAQFLWVGGLTYQYAGVIGNNFGGLAISDTGEVTFTYGDFPEHDVFLMWRIRAPGDFTGDGSVDRFDFESMQNCMSNPGSGVDMPPVCLQLFDFDSDGDIDFSDFAVFQRLVTLPE